ncbi:MAG: helix-turn-helix domain-containing protein [Chitinispirillales bacterium]|nr:helix-turn-helix domain-containing protein [Chitinispirillales bacterium]
MESVGKRIRRLRLELDITQGILSVMAEITRSDISKIENGLINLSAKRAERVAAALGVSPAYIMGREGDVHSGAF